MLKARLLARSCSGGVGVFEHSSVADLWCDLGSLDLWETKRAFPKIEVVLAELMNNAARPPVDKSIGVDDKEDGRGASLSAGVVLPPHRRAVPDFRWERPEFGSAIQSRFPGTARQACGRVPCLRGIACSHGNRCPHR